MKQIMSLNCDGVAGKVGMVMKTKAGKTYMRFDLKHEINPGDVLFLTPENDPYDRLYYWISEDQVFISNELTMGDDNPNFVLLGEI